MNKFKEEIFSALFQEGQLFLEVLAWKRVMSCSTFLPPHFGHLALPASWSLMLIVKENFLLHFGQ